MNRAEGTLIKYHLQQLVQTRCYKTNSSLRLYKKLKLTAMVSTPTTPLILEQQFEMHPILNKKNYPKG